MSLIAWIVIILVVGISIIIIRKMRKKEDYLGNSLDERLGGIRDSFSDVCKKFVGKLFGC